MKPFFMLLILFFMVPVYGATEVVTAKYNAHGAGLHLLDASIDLVQLQKTYESVTRTETRGLLSFLVPAKTTFSVKGKINNNQYVADYFSMNTISSNSVKNREVDLEKKPGFVDYQTAVLTMMNLQKPQTQAFQIADGKRDLLVTFTYKGQVDLDPSPFSCFSGQADYYDVSIEVTAGKKKGWFFNRMKDKSSPPLRLYFARVDKGSKKSFVRGAFDTALFGVITVYLSEFKQGTK